MAYGTLVELKAQLRIDDDTEDDLLSMYLEAAKVYMVHYLGGRAIYESDADVPEAELSDYIIWDDGLKNYQLMLAADYYKHREDSTEAQQNPVSHCVDCYLKMLRIYDA